MSLTKASRAKIPSEVSRLAIFHFALCALNLVYFFLSSNSNEATVSALIAFVAAVTGIGVIRGARLTRPFIWLMGILAITSSGLAIFGYVFLVISGDIDLKLDPTLAIELTIQTITLVLGVMVIRYVRSEATQNYFKLMVLRRKSLQ